MIYYQFLHKDLLLRMFSCFRAVPLELLVFDPDNVNVGSC